MSDTILENTNSKPTLEPRSKLKVELKNSVNDKVEKVYNVLASKLESPAKKGSTFYTIFLPYVPGIVCKQQFNLKIVDKDLSYGFRSGYFREKLCNRFRSEGIELTIDDAGGSFVTNDQTYNGKVGYLLKFRWDKDYNKQCIIL